MMVKFKCFNFARKLTQMPKTRYVRSHQKGKSSKRKTISWNRMLRKTSALNSRQIRPK